MSKDKVTRKVDFRKIQREQNSWSKKNFGNSPFYRPILGVCEEAGELAHHQLKMEIARVVKTGGLICVIAPSGGYEHRFPIDCYRFYPDGMRALAELAGILVLECYCNDVSPWRDTVLIGRKK